MCDNAAKTIRSNHLIHIAWPFSGTKKPVGASLLAPTGSQCVWYWYVELKRGNATVHGQ